jgi:outer membrane protein W
LVAGLTLNRKNHLFDLGIGYLYQNQIPYFITPTQQINLKTQQFWVGLGYKFMLDATLSAEKDWQSGRTEKVTKALAEKKKLNGLTLAIGFSSAHFLKASTHLQQEASFADRFKRANVFPEFGVGYYFHKPDLQFNITYRATSGKIEAFGYKNKANRKSLGLEAYKFIADYHGFVPFIGLNINYEMLKVEEISLSGIPSNASFNGFKPGITFGWDIRPNRIQSWYLRTNLRYTPNLNVKMSSGKDIALDNLEFNFIQLVVFPGRIL